MTGLDNLNQGIISIFDLLIIEEQHWNVEFEGYSAFFVSEPMYNLLATEGNDEKIYNAIKKPVLQKINNIEKAVSNGMKFLQPILPQKVHHLHTSRAILFSKRNSNQ